jgi:hypothetical protein
MCHNLATFRSQKYVAPTVDKRGLLITGLNINRSAVYRDGALRAVGRSDMGEMHVP